MATLKGGKIMGHNYSKHFFNPENKHNRPFVENVEEHVENEETSFLENEEVVENVEQTEEITNIVNYAKGVVSGCDRLNVRADSSKESNVLSILECKVEVKVDLSNNNETSEFYKVITPDGVEGYCMKKFITIN